MRREGPSPAESRLTAGTRNRCCPWTADWAVPSGTARRGAEGREQRATIRAMNATVRAWLDGLDRREVGVYSALVGASIAAVVVLASGGSDATASVLAFAGVLLVAVVTAVTAEGRQRRQLDAEDRRLARQHEEARDLADQRELRSLLEDVALALVEVQVTGTHLGAATRDGDQEHRLRHLEHVPDLLHSLIVSHGRLVVRLGRASPLAVAVLAAAGEGTRWQKALIDGDENADEMLAEYRVRMIEFQTAAAATYAFRAPGLPRADGDAS